MVSVSRFDCFSRLPMVPTWTTSSCSEGSNSRSELHITRAFSNCVIEDIEHLSQPAQAEPSAVPAPPLSAQRRSGRLLKLELSSQPSQEFPGTQDFATPVEQQFLVGYDAGLSNMDDDSRSPAPSPMRYQKRLRPVHLLDADSDGMSQDGASQSRSQGEPSSCSKITAAGPKSRPPIPRHKRRHEPTRLNRSPCVAAADEGDQSGVPQASITPKQQSRLYQDYIVEKEIGRGHFSIVYRAVHRQCGKAYAIKRSKRPLHSAADLQAWLEEVKILATVEGHPNITTYHDSWSEPSLAGDYQHIKLELCGESLGMEVKAKQALPNSELWDITQQMASALKHIHDLGLVHLDLKPDNIYRSQSGTFKLGDFGLSTLRDASKGVSEGDARYLAPELLKNRQGSLEKADMFALGATLYELASGCPLPSTGDRWHAVREGKLMMLPAVTHQLQNLIKKLMSSDPSARPDAAAVLAVCSRQSRSQPTTSS